MIPDLFLGVMFNGAAALIARFPASSLPAFLQSGGALASGMASVVGYMEPAGAWLPFGAGATVIEGMLACLAVAIVVRIIRMTISLVTGGGGNAS